MVMNNNNFWKKKILSFKGFRRAKEETYMKMRGKMADLLGTNRN